MPRRKPRRLALRSPLFSTLFSRQAKSQGTPQRHLPASNWHFYWGNLGCSTESLTRQNVLYQSNSKTEGFFHSNLCKYIWLVLETVFPAVDTTVLYANTSLLWATIPELIPKFAIEFIILITFLTCSFHSIFNCVLRMSRKIYIKTPSTVTEIGPQLAVSQF